jgi:hypothetical protein
LILLGLERCLESEHFVESRILAGFPAVKPGFSTKLSTADVDIQKSPLNTAT